MTTVSTSESCQALAIKFSFTLQKQAKMSHSEAYGARLGSCKDKGSIEAMIPLNPSDLGLHQRRNLAAVIKSLLLNELAAH